MTFWMVLTVFIGGGICYVGLQKGVERTTKLMMAGALLCLMLVLALRSVTLPGAEKGLEFYLLPKLSNLTTNGLLD